MRNFVNKIVMVVILTIVLSTLSACSNPNSQNAKMPSVQEIGDKISQSVDLSEMIQLDDKKVQKLYDINPDELDEYWIYISASNISAQEIAVIKVKESSSIESIKDKLSERIEKQSISFKDYLPEEYHLLENHILKTKGNYILLVVSKDADIVEDIFDKSF